MKRLAAVAAFVVSSLQVLLPVHAQAQMPLPPSPPPAPAGATPGELLRALIEHSRHPLTIANGRLGGPGGELLRSLATPTQYLLMGEAHANQGVADFATALWRELRPLGYRHAAIEVDPWAAAAIERVLPAGNEAWARFVDERGGAAAMPFFTLAPEVAYLHEVIASPAPATPVLWGLDQVFVGGAPWLLKEVAETAAGADARRLAAEFAAEAQARPLQWLGRVEAARLERLRSALSDRADARHRSLVEAMLESAAIYAPFTGGGGEGTLANARREALMRRLFVEHHARAERAAGTTPKVMLKFGANHMYRGATPTLVQGLGGFVTEFAAARGSETLSVVVLCGPGSRSRALDGTEVDCGRLADDPTWSFIAPYVSAQAPTLFDLRTWRLRPRRLQGLPGEAQRAAGAFDLLVFVPGSPAAGFLPGVAAAKREP